MTFKPKWLFLPLILALAGMASAHWTVSGEALRQELAEQVMQAAGLRANAQGKASFAILPRPRIKIENVIISDDRGALVIRTDVLRGNLRLWPLLKGQMELSAVQIDQPDISYDYEGRPFTRMGAIARAAQSPPKSEEARQADRTRLGTISIIEGSARIQKLGDPRQLRLDKINLTLDWPQLSAPLSLTGAFLWQNEKHEIAAWLAKPTDVLRATQSAASLKWDSPSLQFASNGTLTGGPALQFDGRLSATSKSIRNLTQNLGLKTPIPIGAQQVTLTALARASFSALALSNLKLNLDGNAFEGTLAVQAKPERALITGTLASDQIILAPIVSDLPALNNQDGAWSEETLPLGALDFADMDLRFSAAKARLGRALFEDVGAALLLSNGRLDFTLGQAKVYQGQVKGRVTLSPTTQGVALRTSGAFVGIDSETMSKETFRTFRISGDAQGQFALDGQGATMAQIIRSLEGTIETRLRNGDLHGIDLERALRTLERRPLSLLTETRQGRTGFESAQFTTLLSNGRIDFTQALISGLGVQVAMSGHATLADKKLNLRAMARQTGAGAHPRENGPQLLLDIRGTWDEPQIIFDKESLIRRSDAAAPLLRALDKIPNVSAPAAAP